jgi:hypothetical protein
MTMKTSSSPGIKKLSELPATKLRQPGEKTEAEAKTEMGNKQTQKLFPPVKPELTTEQSNHGGAVGDIEAIRFDPESLIQGIIFQTVLGEPRCRRRRVWR